MRYLSIRSMWCEYQKKSNKKSKPTTAKSDFYKNLKYNPERRKKYFKL